MTVRATKISIVAERFLLPRIETIMENAGLAGWSWFPGGGKGSHGLRRAQAASLVREFSIVKIEAVTLDADAAAWVAERLAERVFDRHSGVVWLEEVSVVRGGKFGGDAGEA